MNKIKIVSISLIGIFGFNGCVNNSSLGTSKSYYYYPNTVADCESRNMVPTIAQDGSLFCKSSYDSEQEKLYFEEFNNEATKQRLTYVEYFNKKRNDDRRREEELKLAKQQAFLNKIAQYEIDYLNEYEKIKKQIPDQKIAWVQPKNKKESCKVYVGYSDNKPTSDDSYKLFWDGECKDGYAYGLGREIIKANLEDVWQIGIYERGMAKGGFVLNDNLHTILNEGEANYEGSLYSIIRRVFEKNGDIMVGYESGTYGNKDMPSLIVRNSPFWNQTQVYSKAYPNFKYEFADFRNNNEAQYDTQFALHNNKNLKHGWAIEKMKGSTDYLKGEYVNGVGTKVNLPNEYITKANNIVDEIKQASDKAYEAQAQAQLVKKQYLRKICRESVKVDFMDNEEYKEICDDKAEKELLAKVDAKLQKITQEKIAKLEQQRFSAQQQKEEQYRQQQLAIERQRLEEQRNQTKAMRDVSDSVDFMGAQQYLNDLKQQQNNYSKGIFY